MAMVRFRTYCADILDRFEGVATDGCTLIGFSVAPLAALLRRESDGEVGLAAIEALGEIGDEAAVEVSLVALRSRSVEHRGKAAIALGQIGDPRAVGALAKLTLADRSLGVRMAAVEALGCLQVPEATSTLISAVDEVALKFSHIVGEVTEQLMKMAKGGKEDVVEPLYGAAGSANVNVRMAVAWALGGIRSARSADTLAELVTVVDPDVRGRAALSLVGMPDTRAVDGLIEGLQSGVVPNQHAAAWELGEI